MCVLWMCLVSWCRLVCALLCVCAAVVSFCFASTQVCFLSLPSTRSQFTRCCGVVLVHGCMCGAQLNQLSWRHRSHTQLACGGAIRGKPLCVQQDVPPRLMASFLRASALPSGAPARALLPCFQDTHRLGLALLHATASSLDACVALGVAWDIWSRLISLQGHRLAGRRSASVRTHHRSPAQPDSGPARPRSHAKSSIPCVVRGLLLLDGLPCLVIAVCLPPAHAHAHAHAYAHAYAHTCVLWHAHMFLCFLVHVPFFHVCATTVATRPRWWWCGCWTHQSAALPVPATRPCC